MLQTRKILGETRQASGDFTVRKMLNAGLTDGDEGDMVHLLLATASTS